MLVTVGNWGSSTTIDHYRKTITASAWNVETGARHWIDGKQWRYHNWQQLDTIQRHINALKVRFGILQEYTPSVASAARAQLLLGQP